MAKEPEQKVISRQKVMNQLEELSKLIMQTPRFKAAKKPRLGKDSVPDVPPDTLNDMLNFLRVSIKYQLFDLNAHRLEILYLKKLCKENNIDV